MSVESGSDSSAEGENVGEQPPRKYVPPIRPVGRGAYGIVCNLCNNKIGGNIPLSLPPNLEELLLSRNEINGLIPPSISSLSQIVAMLSELGLEAAVETMAEFLNKAVKLVLVADPKLRVAKAQKTFVDLADACRYPIVVMPSGKGLVPEHHPHFIGSLGHTRVL